MGRLSALAARLKSQAGFSGRTGEAEESFNQFLRLARQRDSRDRQPEIPGLAYRISLQTNSCSLLGRDGEVHPELPRDDTIAGLHDQAWRALEQIKEARFQGVAPSRSP
ncbi:MAG: hypothetical protein A2V70_14465 [Planctomycetes bacterium RBG_13_63_9]|nr:MAG: hypothetical protein A2V70_14465 [Planctomycetes bacterium RBG_13_63_9]